MDRMDFEKNKRRLLLMLTVICLLGMQVLGGCGKAQTTVKDEVRIGSLKGPTSMGLLFMMEKNRNNQLTDAYTFEMAVGADELLALMVQDKLDIALVPANVAAVLYQKTEGEICAIDINTLGVLYLVSADTTVKQISDLSGRTVYLTGKGTTPDYVLQYLLENNGVTDCKLEYKSEATEVAAVLSEKPQEIGLLPQPFVEAALAQNDALAVAVSFNEEWEKLDDGSMVTGVTVVRKEYLENHKALVERFLKEHKESVEGINADPQKGAALCVDQGIVAKEPIAKKAISKCNLVCITGEEMKNALNGYLTVLYEKDPKFVGGALPGDDFYFEK